VCVNDVAPWFLKNGLLLNPNKTEAVLFGTSALAQRKKIPTTGGIDETAAVVPYRDTVKAASISAIKCTRVILNKLNYPTVLLLEITAVIHLLLEPSSDVP